jgi:hypothetical protein
LPFSGDPGRTRTCDQQLRRLLLYPPELRGHCRNVLPTQQLGRNPFPGESDFGHPSGRRAGCHGPASAPLIRYREVHNRRKVSAALAASTALRRSGHLVNDQPLAEVTRAWRVITRLPVSWANPTELPRVRAFAWVAHGTYPTARTTSNCAKRESSRLATLMTSSERNKPSV